MHEEMVGMDETGHGPLSVMMSVGFNLNRSIGNWTGSRLAQHTDGLSTYGVHTSITEYLVQ